jgi:hypothetical protein
LVAALQFKVPERLPGKFVERTQKFAIGEHQIELTMIPARQGRRLAVRISRLLTQPIFNLLTFRDEEHPHGFGYDELVAMIVGQGANAADFAAKYVLPPLFAVIEGEGEEVEEIERELLVGRCKIDGRIVESLNDIDDLLPNAFTSLKLLWAAVRVNYFPTYGAPDTSDGPSASRPEAPKKPKRKSKKKSSAKKGTRSAGRRGQTRTKNGRFSSH